MNTSPAIEWTNVTKEFGPEGARVQALAGVSLAVAPGELVAIMGPSGSAKSTLLHLAGGLEPMTSGDIHVAGKSVAGMGATELARLFPGIVVVALVVVLPLGAALVSTAATAIANRRPLASSLLSFD